MNTIFAKYLAGIGKRYASCASSLTFEVTFTHGDIHKLYSVTSFEYDGKELRFFESGDTGFLARSVAEHVSNMLPLHKSIVQEIGVISDMYGFFHKYLQNLSELFPCDSVSQNVDDLIEDFQRKADEESLRNGYKGQSAVHMLENLTTFAYEANGNRFMYNEQGEVFLYGMDHAYEQLQQIAYCPAFTLYRVPSILRLEDFALLFFSNNN